MRDIYSYDTNIMSSSGTSALTVAGGRRQMHGQGEVEREQQIKKHTSECKHGEHVIQSERNIKGYVADFFDE